MGGTSLAMTARYSTSAHRAPPGLSAADVRDGRRLRLGKVLFQPRDLIRGPAVQIRHLDPRLDVVRWGVDVAVADRRRGRHELVHRQLKKSDDRVPAQLWRHVWSARRQHPVRFAIETATVEEGHGIACILEINEPHRSPCGIRSRGWAGGVSVLVHEPHERSITEPRKPGGRSGIAMVGEETPEPA